MSLYLDYNASTPLCGSAKQAMLDGMALGGNASSVHQFGRQVRQKIEQARQDIADYFEASPAGVIFTSGATEANHLALCGFEGGVIISAIEHDSIDQARPDREVCPVDGMGIIDLKALEALLQNKSGPVLVSVMAANNETGVIQPLPQVVAIAKQYGALVHCDAVQAIGKIPLSWEGIDLISISAHKLGGPQGVGALVMRTDVALKAQLRGGGQERSFRSGTENYLGILGFAAALKRAKPQEWIPVKTLRDALEKRLKEKNSEAVFLANEAERLPNTAIIAMKGVKSATQVMNFDLKGIAISAGAACSSGKVKSSRVLKAMGVPDALADCSIRVSLGVDTPPEMVDRFLDVWIEIYERAHAPSSFGEII
ncbi:MAG: cysteine desulfurase [Alphaproteobacteria bacterium]|jgi:cysteine desulfurase|nr:cysteine desulfurase [Alphaproteobacteria bacterium]